MASSGPVIVRAVPGKRCLNCLKLLENRFKPKTAKLPIVSAYFCADCSAALDIFDKCYLVGWHGIDHTIMLVKDNEQYQMGLDDRARAGFDDEACNAEYVGDQNECTCNPMGWNTEKDCPLHDE